MPILDTPSGKLFYAEKDAPLSKRPPLILVHGVGGSHLVWPAELRRLPDTRVIAMDLPGHGRSALPGRQSVMAYAESVRHLMQALAIPRAIIAGHSMGGGIAQAMGVAMPDSVAGLVLLATGPRLKINPLLLTVRENMEAVADFVDKWQWSREIGEDLRRKSRELFMSIDSDVLYGDYLACDTFAIEDQLPLILAPTLIIGSDTDKMTPFALSEALAQGIPNHQLIKLSGPGHMIQLEHGDLVAQHIDRWLSINA
ncbi:MAG: alpha/beta hydrolase [Anaerolineales bacterium]|nr:alpha/beta hydrolase [Anaerolineales bacterium]